MRDEVPFEEWLQKQELGLLLTRGEKEQLGKAVRAVGELRGTESDPYPGRSQRRGSGTAWGMNVNPSFQPLISNPITQYATLQVGELYRTEKIQTTQPPQAVPDRRGDGSRGCHAGRLISSFLEGQSWPTRAPAFSG